MEAQAVRLHDQLELRPVEVDPAAAEATLGLGQRKPCPPDDEEKALLEHGVGEDEPVAVEQPRNGAGAGAPMRGRTQLVQIDEVAVHRFVDRALEVRLVEPCGEIDQGPDRGGGRDALFYSNVERSTPVN